MGSRMAVVLLDIILRRLGLPLILTTSVIFRYNVLSLVYLLLFMTSLLLPGPRLKAQKASSLVHLTIVLVWSGFAVIAQVLFQIVLATDYSDQLQPCEQKENIWRQFGFILFNGDGIKSVDVVRHLLPDCIVFVAALTSLVTNALVVARLSKGTHGGAESSPREDPDETGQNSGKGGDDEHTDIPSASNASGCFSQHVQCYRRLPKVTFLLFDICVFITLGLAGVAIPSVTSFVYYTIFLFTLAIWGSHQSVRFKGVMRVLRCGLTFYTMLHIMVLYLYQFQAAQQNIPLHPDNTYKSLLARLFGLTAIIHTDCEQPSHLQLHSNLEYPVYISPALLLLLCLLLATELRLWINTPDILWREHEVYYFPVRDTPPSSFVVCLVSSGKAASPEQWTEYGTYRIKGQDRQAVVLDETRVQGASGTKGASGEDHGDVNYAEYQEQNLESGDGEGVDETVTVVRRRRFQVTWQDLKQKILHGLALLWSFLLTTSYVPAIICMMLWSVLYPSWPALTLLLWACAIWLIPKFTPKDSLFYTSPLLIVYSVCLLILQYVFSLDLTLDELSPVDGLGQECYNTPTPGCKSFVPIVKTTFTVVFFCAFHEFVTIRLDRNRQTNADNTTDGEMPLIAMHIQEELADEGVAITAVQKMSSELIRSGYTLLKSYWVLVVIAAFLVVFLTGEPNLFKTIYLIFFFVFLVTYQVFRHCWYYICVPVWWGLVLYAALELVLIYTYQFDSISDAWERAYNNTPHITQDYSDLFNSIGLRKYGINSLRSLLISLVPPAIFIAVMAMQLRYFSPTMSATDAASYDLSSFLPATLRSYLIRTTSASQDATAEANDFPDEDPNESNARSRPMSRADSTASSGSPGTPLYYFYQIFSYLVLKAKQIVMQLILLFWRFMELHLHKVSMLVLFVVVLSEVSAGYWVLLTLSLLAIPLPYFSGIFYPLLTIYIGLLSVLKTIYQFPIIKSDMFNLTNYNDTGVESHCYEPLNSSSYLGNYSGLVFQYHYSSRAGDSGWFGLHKVSNYAEYLAGPLCVALLLALQHSAVRHQALINNTVVCPSEKGSLFLNVSRRRADSSVVAACKYLANHAFEIYGVEITVIMIAIAITVRVDVYGMFYCVVLGLMIFLPRGVITLVWLPYTVIHGLLLIFQYSMLLGVPQGLCYYPGSNKEYPWMTMSDHEVTNFGLKKWFFLTDYPQILDKSSLYVDFVVYMLLCIQLYNFRPIQDFGECLSDYISKESLINFIKVFLTKYYFWVSIFLVFFAAISRVSFFGFLYLLLCFVLLYRGQDMLVDRQNRRIKSWAILRLLAWAILFVRVSVQIADCVFYSDLPKRTQCNLILAFNGACNRKNFYGSPNPDCESYPHNVGLWVDALTIAVVTFQIIIFRTQYSEMMKEYLLDWNKKAGYFSDVFEEKMEKRQQVAKEIRKREILELTERAQQLSSAENIINHILHAGVNIPPSVLLRTESKQPVMYGNREEETVSDGLAVSDTDSEEPKSKYTEYSPDTNAIVEEASKLSKFWKFISNAVIEFIDKSIEFLEKSSSIYVEIVEELKQQRKRLEEDDASSDISGETQAELTWQPEKEPTIGKLSPVELAAVSPVSEQTGEDTHETHSKIVRFATEGQPTVATEDHAHIAEFEDELSKVAEKYRKRPARFLRALQNAVIAHAEYVVYFLVVLNVIINGSILSIGYVCLLFAWGLFCIPWPSKTFWLSMIFYSMLVLILKYGFQFYEIKYDDNLETETGLLLPNILGVVYYKNSADFFKNATWDMLLLIALLLNRAILKQNGLWRDYNRKGSGFLVISDVKRFYSRLLNPDISLGASDYYVIMLFFDVLCLITIVFGISSFGVGVAGGGVSQAATFIQSNYVPLPFVVMLLLQFLSMLVDRAIYLRHALKAKFLFQIFLLVVWNLWLLFILPSEAVTKQPFTENIAAQCIYFFKAVYFIISAIQIISGYPARVLGYFLGRQYTTVSGLLFTGYRTIPLLPELREVMDWVFTNTALSLFHWLRVQEIYAKLYLVKVRREREEGTPRDLGTQQSLVIKALLGGLLLVGLVLLIWGPLLIMSFINSTSVSNPPVGATISLSLDGYEPLVHITVQREAVMSLTSREYEHLRDSLESEVQPLFGNLIFSTDFMKVIFPNESTSLWTISPPAKLLLLNRLQSVKYNSTSIALQFSWNIQREPVISSAAGVVSGSTTRSLKYEENPTTIDNFISSLSDNNTEVSLVNLYPRIISAPANGQSENYTDLSRFFTSRRDIECSTSLSSATNSSQQWWTLTKCTSPIFIQENNLGPLILLIYSQRIASQLLSVIAGFGIIGLYVSVVLVIGRLIRSAISSLPSQLLLDEIVNPDPLLKLCNDIFTVRESRDFKLEEILVGKLFAIFRSPERLIELTEKPKRKQD